jgi:hypothetical protein
MATATEKEVEGVLDHLGAFHRGTANGPDDGSLREFGPSLPDVQFSADRIEVQPGETATLRWHVDGAEEVVYWASPYEPVELAPLSWLRIAELGDRVGPEGEVVVRPDRTSVNYLLARDASRAVCAQVVIRVRAASAPASAGPHFECQPGPLALRRMTDHPLRVRPPSWQRPTPAAVSERVAELVHWLHRPGEGMVPLINPFVNVSVDHPVVFADDDPPKFSWTSVGATCVTAPGYGVQRQVLVPGLDADPAFLMSGTAQDGASYGSGGFPLVCLPASGQYTFPKALYAPPYGPGTVSWGIDATGPSGEHASAGSSFDVLPVPTFTGAVTDARRALVRSSLKDIGQKLRSGGILSDAKLDTTVAAFKDGRLSKYQVWMRLLLEIRNLQNLVFHCEEQTSGGGSWADYSNTINLYWNAQTNQGPSDYALLHELVHKCGFNGRLLSWYSTGQIEDQTDLVASSCYP